MVGEALRITTTSSTCKEYRRAEARGRGASRLCSAGRRPRSDQTRPDGGKGQSHREYSREESPSLNNEENTRNH
ncbi:hypothetical protein E2C01_081069 [Portunus trituberculatus]|uniref:Uncharacterized protein n=1 Tax=Portunus trituberculatus TaxID=210409 RepID=A0A5B7IX12_PORTR|nr:hypothetical protein [Portunus trituberculatus]